jgi:subtilisin family serine protease
MKTPFYSDAKVFTQWCRKLIRMDEWKKVCVYSFFVFLFAFHTQSVAQSSAVSGAGGGVRGERPSVAWQSIPIESMEAGIIRIKFRPELTPILDQASISKTTKGIPRFGMQAIDALNQKYGVTAVRPTFAGALAVTSFNERHRRWGFHLWYDLFFPSGSNVREIVTAYSSLKEVGLAEPVFKKQLLNFTPSDPSFGLQWNYHNTGQAGGTSGCDIRLPEAWSICKGNPNVIVAVIDGGIDYTHNDLAGNMWSGTGWNFIDNNGTITPHYHGTHVAGTIAANTNNALGVSGIAGGNGSGNGVRLMSCQVFHPSGSNGGFETAPVWAADHGAAISQNSWGYTIPGVFDTPVLDAIDYFNSYGGGSVLNGGVSIFSAGNSNSEGQWYPACYSGCIAVAASNNKDQKSYYSNYGDWVDITAPGGEMSFGSDPRGIYSTQPGNTCGYLQGTSMACPHVSGVAALIVSLAPSQLTAQALRNILLNTADNIYPSNPGYTGKLGSGRVNAYAALQFASAYPAPTLSEWGIIILGFALLCGGAVFLFRKRTWSMAR